MPAPTEFLRVSYSSLNTLDSCDRKFEFDKLYPKRERLGEDWYAADVGKALHAGFQDYLIHHDKEQAIWKFMCEFPFESEFSQPNDYRNFDASLAVLEEMFIEAKLQEYELARIIRPNTPSEVEAGLTGGVEVPAIEVPFSIRFNNFVLPDGRGIEFIGFIDAIMRHYSTRMFRTLDIKTSRMALKDSTAKYKFDAQQVPYGLVVDQIAQGQVDEFEVLYLDSYIDLLEPKVTLYPFVKKRQDIEEWFTNTLLKAQRIKQFMAADYFPRRAGGCVFFNKPCRYLEICESRDREFLTEWFLMGEEPGKDRDDGFQPWIIAEINVEA